MTNTVDKREIEQFSSLSNKWWDMSGPFSALHKMSNARIEFIKQNATRVFNRDNMIVNVGVHDIVYQANATHRLSLFATFSQFINLSTRFL